MPFVTVRELRMYYELRGTGPRLLGISGTGGDLRRFPTIFELLPVQGFEILAYDQRGLGQTSRPDIPYTMADYADDANALIESIGWDRCLVAGFSFGGMVAQELALCYPHRVERLVLASTSSGGTHPGRPLTPPNSRRSMTRYRRACGWGPTNPGAGSGPAGNWRPGPITIPMKGSPRCKCLCIFAEGGTMG
jgi:pimeloyl-ACP methyl ester carboxylesterase